MSAPIEQFNVSYSPDEDRLLLRVRSSAGEEYRLWMTRRFTRLLLQVILKLLRQEHQQGQALDPLGRAAEIAFEHESATAQADYSTPYDDQVGCYPLGEDGILGYRITVDSGEKPALHLLPREGAGLSFPVLPNLLHNLQHLLSSAIRGADWNLSAGLEELPASRTSRSLN